MDKLALSVKQPYAWLLCKGYKDGENRNWALPGGMHNRVTYIHASSSRSEMTNEVYDWVMRRLTAPASFEFQKAFDHMIYGAIIGELVFTSCMRDAKSEWYSGDWFFRSKDGVLYETPIVCRGMPGFFKPQIEVRHALL